MAAGLLLLTREACPIPFAASGMIINSEYGAGTAVNKIMAIAILTTTHSDNKCDNWQPFFLETR